MLPGHSFATAPQRCPRFAKPGVQEKVKRGLFRFFRLEANWPAKQITRTVRTRAVTKEGIDATLLQHVSPIEWDNVSLYGQPGV